MLMLVLCFLHLSIFTSITVVVVVVARPDYFGALVVLLLSLILKISEFR